MDKNFVRVNESNPWSRNLFRTWKKWTKQKKGQKFRPDENFGRVDELNQKAAKVFEELWCKPKKVGKLFFDALAEKNCKGQEDV